MLEFYFFVVKTPVAGAVIVSTLKMLQEQEIFWADSLSCAVWLCVYWVNTAQWYVPQRTNISELFSLSRFVS
jgi:hypothetical protein